MTDATLMQKLFGLAGALVASFTLSFAISPAFADPSIGKMAPDFIGVASDGKSYRLSDLRGKTVVLEWTNHECPFVGKHYGTGNMQALQKKATGDGVMWLSVISSAPGLQGHVTSDEANKLTASRDAAPSAVILDGEGYIGRAYGATATPHMFVINAKGMLAYMGAIDDKPSANHADVKIAKNYVRMALNALAAGEPLTTRVTRAYGCSVKYGF